MKSFKQLSVKILILPFALLSISCGNDDSQEPIDSPLVGSWKWTINERLNCPGSDDDEKEFEVYDCTDFCYDVEFRKDGTATVTTQEDGVTKSGTGVYTLSGSDFTLCVTDAGTEYCDSGKLTILGDTFIWFIEAEDETVCDVNRRFEKQ